LSLQSLKPQSHKQSPRLVLSVLLQHKAFWQAAPNTLTPPFLPISNAIKNAKQEKHMWKFKQVLLPHPFAHQSLYPPTAKNISPLLRSHQPLSHIATSVLLVTKRLKLHLP
jgi:hypothetical protein